jgi:hypothetical protein
MKTVDWQRHEKNIWVKVEHWFEIMDKQLSQRDIVRGNVYNVNETGVLLSDLNTVEVIVSHSDARRNCRVGLRRTMITAVECISADGRCLGPLIIWSGKTLSDRQSLPRERMARRAVGREECSNFPLRCHL